jgi:hypothetical protein
VSACCESRFSLRIRKRWQRVFMGDGDPSQRLEPILSLASNHKKCVPMPYRPLASLRSLREAITVSRF